MPLYGKPNYGHDELFLTHETVVDIFRIYNIINLTLNNI